METRTRILRASLFAPLPAAPPPRRAEVVARLPEREVKFSFRKISIIHVA